MIVNLREKNSRLDQNRTHTQTDPWVKIEFIWIAQLVRAPARRSGDPGSNPGPAENLLFKLTTQDLPDIYTENQIINNMVGYEND